jgi:hypothetical protein
MISISLVPPEPRWITIEPAKDGKPAFEMLFAPVGKSMRRRAMRAAREEFPDIGIDAENADIDILLDGVDAQSRHLIRLAARDWRGVSGTETGEPVPFSSDALDAAIADEDSGFFDMVEAAWIEPMRARQMEKNGLSALPNGTGKVETASPKATAD